MKLIIPTLALAGSAYASSITMPSVEAEEAAKAAGIPEKTESTDKNGARLSWSYRSFLAANLVERWEDLADIENLEGQVNRVMREYGCNCYKSKGAGLHQLAVLGAPIDNIDGICAHYARVFACITKDSGSDLVADYSGYPENHWQINAQEGGDDHNPSDTEPPSVNLDGNPHPIVRQCGQWSTFEHHVDNQGSVICGPVDNPNYANSPANDCAKMVCEISQAFVDALVVADPDRFSDPKGYWRANKNDSSKYGLNCAQVEHAPVESCCGSYPSDRVPVVPNKQECCNRGASNEYVAEKGQC